MTDFQRDAAMVAAISALFIFLGKVLDRLFGWRRQRETFAERLRSELDARATKMVEENEKLRAEADLWRERYHTAKEEIGKLRLDYAALRQDFDELTKKLEEAGVTP